MSITLGGVTLSEHMLWPDEDDYSLVEGFVARTLGGGMVIRDQTLVKGRPITLEAQIDQGWLTKAQVDAVRALANVAGAQYDLVIGIQNFLVKFRNQDQPAFSATALIPRTDAEATDYYTCIIKLMTV